MSYAERFNRQPDFRVRYEWLSQNELHQKPFQHMRCDFSYDGDDIQRTGIYMIWPEFEDANGPIAESEPVPQRGTATMWIINAEVREEIHQHRLQPGVLGFFMVGSCRVARAEVTELLGLRP